MKIRAVLFDIYKTLLEVRPAPADAAERWGLLWQKWLKIVPRLDLAEFGAACDAVVAREHKLARAVGVDFPEVYWPDIVREVLPETASLSCAGFEEFQHGQTCLWHSVSLMPGAAKLLAFLAGQRFVLGLLSNCQPYSLRELDIELSRVGLDRSIFRPELCFFSFQHGFSKPNPHAFRLMSIRLRALGISPPQTLMVGDRLDNDIAPAKAQGWRTWLLSSASECPDQSGSCEQLAALLGS
jgi:FMN phosphatase YigB (HAD superfamily)